MRLFYRLLLASTFLASIGTFAKAQNPAVGPVQTTNGTLVNPTITGGTITGANVTGLSLSGSDASGANVTATGSTLARMEATRAAEIINVLDRGFVCDGVTDNGTAMTALVASVTSGTVYFPPAISPCLTSVKLTLRNGVTYFAYPGTVILKPTAGSVANPVLIQGSSASNVLIQGLIIDGGGVDFLTANALALISGGDNVVFQSVLVQNSRGIGVAFNGNNSNSGVQDSTFTNIGNHWITTGNTSVGNPDQKQGLTFSTGTLANNFGNFSIRNKFSDVGLDAVSVGNQTNFNADGNQCKNVGGQYTNGGACVYVSNSSSLKLTNNIVNGTFGNGLDVITTNLATIIGNNVQFAGGAGISYAQGTGATITGNVTCNSNKSGGLSTLRAGITLNGNSIPVANVTVSGNTTCDNQVSPTQPWGIQNVTGGTYTNVWIDQSNTIYGNVTSPFGQALAGYSAPSATVGYISQYGSAPNQGVAAIPTGTGALTAAVPDSTTVGGNARGANAVDLQTVRSSAGHVASGGSSAILGGANNSAAGQFAINVCGQWCINSGPSSTTLGSFANSEFRNAVVAFTGAQFAVQGDSQAVDQVLMRQSTSATSVILTATNVAPASGNIMNVGLTSISVKRAMRGRVYAVARSAADVKEWSCDYLMNSGAGAATVTMVGSSCTSAFATGGAASWTFALTADTTNGGLTATATGAAATTINWVARVMGVENGSL